jgi:putative cell wall-binding protein
VKKYRPTIGFSLEQASLAVKVTVIGNTQSFSDEQLDLLRNAGCQVERISGDGTSIATQLQER